MKRSFLDCRSLTEMAFTLVMLGVLSVFPIGVISGILCAVVGLTVCGLLGLSESEILPLLSLGISVFCWIAVVIGLWLHFVSLGRGWKAPNLATQEFFLFQVAAGVFVLGLTWLFPWTETAPIINSVRVFFAVLSVLMNFVYVSLAIGIKVSLPPRIFVALAADVAIALLPLLGK